MERKPKSRIVVLGENHADPISPYLMLQMALNCKKNNWNLTVCLEMPGDKENKDMIEVLDKYCNKTLEIIKRYYKVFGFIHSLQKPVFQNGNVIDQDQELYEFYIHKMIMHKALKHAYNAYNAQIRTIDNYMDASPKTEKDRIDYMLGRIKNRVRKDDKPEMILVICGASHDERLGRRLSSEEEFKDYEIDALCCFSGYTNQIYGDDIEYYVKKDRQDIGSNYFDQKTKETKQIDSKIHIDGLEGDFGNMTSKAFTSHMENIFGAVITPLQDHDYRRFIFDVQSEIGSFIKSQINMLKDINEILKDRVESGPSASPIIWLASVALLSLAAYIGRSEISNANEAVKNILRCTITHGIHGFSRGAN